MTDFENPTPYTAADALMDTLHTMGVEYCFINTGTDYPALIESWAKAERQGKRLPTRIICPHETVAMSAAHGYAARTGRPQAVLVHADVGTQNIGGALHNAARGRVPLFIFAGASPYTMEGELPGSRNYYIQFIQDVPDQRGIVRQYTKWDYEIRTGKHVGPVIARSLQLAASEPSGPVYVVGAREVLEESAPPLLPDPRHWRPIPPVALAPHAVGDLADALSAADFPLIITSFSGRNPETVSELRRLAERLAIPVVEPHPIYVNFPSDHPLHLGYDDELPERLEQADVILVIDSDYPWIPANHRPRRDARIFILDVDPLKPTIPLWYFPAEQHWQANSNVALVQLNAVLANRPIPATVAARRQATTEAHNRQRMAWKQAAQSPTDADGCLSAAWMTATLSAAIGEDALVVNEAVTHNGVVNRHLPRNLPGTMIGSGGSSLGWNGGAAIGAKLAAPEKTVVSLSGDGAFIFSNPTAVHWTSRRYGAPFLTVIFNNRGWGSVKGAVASVHKDGIAWQDDRFWVDFHPSADFAAVAHAAGGTKSYTVSTPEAWLGALSQGLDTVRSGRSALIAATVHPVSKQFSKE